MARIIPTREPFIAADRRSGAAATGGKADHLASSIHADERAIGAAAEDSALSAKCTTFALYEPGISVSGKGCRLQMIRRSRGFEAVQRQLMLLQQLVEIHSSFRHFFFHAEDVSRSLRRRALATDRTSTRLNSSH